MSFTLHIASTLYLPNSLTLWFLQKYVKLDQKSWESAQTSRRVNPMAASFHALYLLPQLNSACWCLVNSAQNQLGPILTWPKTNSAQLNNQLGPRYVPTQPKHDSCLFLYYFLPFLTPICPSIGLFDFFSFFLSWIRSIEWHRDTRHLSTSISGCAHSRPTNIAPIIVHISSNYTTKSVWKGPKWSIFGKTWLLSLLNAFLDQKFHKLPKLKIWKKKKSSNVIFKPLYF